jgi:uncharacterized protein (TIRG00374 family)
VLFGLTLAVDMPSVAQRLAGISLPFLLLALCTTAASVLLSSLRFRLIATSLTGERYALRTVVAINLFTVLSAHLLPVAAAADAVRVWLVRAKLRVPLKTALMSVVHDRVLALLGICVCLLAVLPLQRFCGAPAGVVGLQAVVAAIPFLAVLLLTVAERAGMERRVLWWSAVVAYNSEVRQRILGATRFWAQLGLAAGIALVFAATIWLLAVALGEPLSLLAALAFAPAIYLAQVVPIFYFGFGAREAMSMLLIGGAGVSSMDSAFALGMAVGLCNLLVSLPAAALAGHALARPAGPGPV